MKKMEDKINDVQNENKELKSQVTAIESKIEFSQKELEPTGTGGDQSEKSI